MHARIFLLFCLSLSWILPAYSASLPATWERALQAYKQQNYSGASAMYEQLIRDGYADVALYYNLGNCYMQMGNKGRAVLAYECALRLDPGNSDVQANLAFVRTTLEDQISALEPYPVLALLSNPQQILRSHTWLWIGLIGIWISIGIGIWIRKRGMRSGSITMIALFILALLGIGLGVLSYVRETDQKEAVFLLNEASIHVAPDERSPESRKIHSGTKVRILEEAGTWRKIRLENGDEGWFTGKGLAIIGIPKG